MEDSRINEGETLSFSDFLERSCIEYMAIGMTYEQFWDGDNDAPKLFREVWNRKAEFKDYDYWHSGQYVNMAVINAISRMGESEKDIIPYPEKPFMEQERERKDIEKQKDYKEKEALAAQQWMKDLVNLYADVPKDSA